MKTISIVIPVYNSSESLYEINNEINKFFDKTNYQFEKIYVNDASRDGSHNILKRIALKFNEIERTKVINLKENVGQQNAIFCGFKYASGDYIVTMDDDLQHNINYLVSMIEILEGGAELVYGVCDTQAEKSNEQNNYRDFDIRTFGSNLTGRFFKSNFKNLSGKRVSSFRAFDKKLLPKILNCQYKFVYISAIMLNYTSKVENITINKRSRVYGKSGYDVKKLIVLFLKLNFYYSKYSVEMLKPRSSKFEISELINVFNEENYAKGNDIRGRKMSS